ncbi:uncharacterized protein METZ01_LOCUS512034 [marine metagenome]|uniref:Uncharacterized protein n=1 Tax=marine metagenome TaxID=408172 RepID=A0A383ES95_9ZZZZ|tara:strand:+ start:2322 stop:2585 length:264 start_codon:yes stop_codon:yes gene_type:complete
MKGYSTDDDGGHRSLEAQEAKRKEAEKLMKAFLKKGGKVQQIPYGMRSEDTGANRFKSKFKKFSRFKKKLIKPKTKKKSKKKSKRRK